MDDAADVRKREEEPAMGRRVGGRVERALDLLALEIDEDHVVGRERRIVDAARLDRENAAGARSMRARVAEGQVDEPVAARATLAS